MQGYVKGYVSLLHTPALTVDNKIIVDAGENGKIHPMFLTHRPLMASPLRFIRDECLDGFLNILLHYLEQCIWL